MKGNTSGTAVNKSASLFLPGNLFGAELPEWVLMRHESFLTVPNNHWDCWKIELLQAGLGVLALLIIAGYTTKGRLAQFVYFTPKGPVQGVHLLCSKVLAVWSVGTCVLLVPIFTVGANYYSC